jgi:hypothetical protein
MAHASSTLTVVLLLAGVAAASCGTEAKGVSDCQNIEKARCKAAPSCGIASDVDDCIRFYHDQCLHGLAVAPPGKVAIADCVSALDDAGVCAEQGADDPSACAGSATPASSCDKILHPERLTACNFLSPSEPSDDESGGNGGSAGQSSGGTPAAAGSGGTASSEGETPAASGGSAGSQGQEPSSGSPSE